jgi:hypothetical protein
MGSLKKYYFGKSKMRSLNEQLVAYYKLDANANDSIGTANGASTNISYANAGKIGNCGTFNGASSLITIPDNTNFNFSNATNDLPFSMSFWIYNTGNGGDQAIIYRRGAGASNEQWQIQKLSSGTMTVGLFTNTTNLIRRGGGSADLNTWTHFTVTYNGSATASGITWYKNGVLNQDAPVLVGTYAKMPIAVQTTYIGRISFSGSGFLNARFDEFGIWKNRELTADEVLYLYNSSNGRTTPF